MRIGTQFIITMLLFGVVVAVISASAIITNRQVQTAREQRNIAVSIVQGASELSYLSNDYVIYRESQQFERWLTRFASFSGDVARLQTDKPEQRALVRNIQENTRRLKGVFDSVASGAGSPASTDSSGAGPSPNHGRTFNLESLRVSWSRMAVQSQVLVSDASRLSQLLTNQVRQLQRVNAIVFIMLIGVFLVYFLVNYLITQRRALKGIANIQAGTAVIGSGNLDFRIEEKRNDEIGDLSRAFNRMTVSLKEVTASKAELEREIEERKEAQKDLEGFAYTVSHDLRAPLRAIDGFVRLILRDHGDCFDEEAQRKFNVVKDNARMMGQLIDDLLLFSRIGRSELKCSRLDMTRLVREVVEETGEAGAEGGHDIRIGELPEAYADRALIKQVMVNLLSNAVKFSRGKQGAPIEIGALHESDEWTYYVKDCGAGFDMKYYDKLFSVFQRLHSEEQFEGTGAGLAIVHRIVHKHGGRIWAEGKPGQGAAFYFTLPKEKK